jgi:hypothetical protein
VGIEQALESLYVLLFGRTGKGDAGVVDEDVDPTVSFDGSGHQRGPVLEVTYVTAHGQCIVQDLGQRQVRLVAGRGEHHMSACCVEGFGELGAKAGRGSRHHRHATLEGDVGLVSTLCARVTLSTSHTSADPVPDVEDKAEDHKDPSPTGQSAGNRVVGKDVEQVA